MEGLVDEKFMDELMFGIEELLCKHDVELYSSAMEILHGCAVGKITMYIKRKDHTKCECCCVIK